MISVAFWYDRPIGYTGGLNYLRNLLYAISLVDDKEIKPYVFFESKADKSIIEQFSQYATVVQTTVLDRYSFPWFLHKVLFKLFGSLFIVNRLMKKYGIFVVSHAENLYGEKRSFKLVTWIPDFQYRHLPEMFPGLNSEDETRRIRTMISASDVVVLSSYDALGDFKKIADQGRESKARVIQFVSQPSNTLYEGDVSLSSKIIEQKYNFSGKYFFLPNQFWKHKNHQVVFDAVKSLKDNGIEILVLCTGNPVNYCTEDTSHADALQSFINMNNLTDNIRILGLIDYKDVLFLMRNSLAVLNPSRFEGWSSSVEEAKSIGKKVILSSINVHIEQNPAGGIYFDPDDPAQLADILFRTWEEEAGGVDAELEKQARGVLTHRTLEYGRMYVDMIRHLVLKES